MTIPASPLDLTTIYAIKKWLTISDPGTDDNLQACLTAASVYVLRYTGRGPRNWQNATQSPFNEAVDYQEVYDGISGNKLFLRNFPINSISSLVVGYPAFTIPAATGTNGIGYVVDDQGRSVAILQGGGYTGRGYSGQVRGGNYGFRPLAGGVQSIKISYNAGFMATPVVGELHNVVPPWVAGTVYSTNDLVSDGVYLQQALNSGTAGSVVPTWGQLQGQQCTDGTTPINWLNTGVLAAPNMVVLENDTATLSDQGVSYFNSGTAFTKVNIAPSAAGEYYLVAPGVYLFNVADAGVEVLISYTSAGTPGDLILAVIQLVSLNYKRRDWIGLRSVAMKDVGSTSYTLLIDPGIKEVLELYRRTSMSS